MHHLIPLFPRVIVFAAVAVFAQEATAGPILEGEKLRILKKTGNVRPQDLKSYGVGAWSGDAHLWWTDAKPGEKLDLALAVPEAGKYRVAAGFTKAVDYGTFTIALDGQKLTGPMDFYNAGVVHTGTVALGEAVTLTAGEHILTFTVEKANAKAIPGNMLGLDYLLLASGDAAEVAALGPKLNPAKKPQPPAASSLKMGNADDAQPRTAEEQRKAFTLPDGFEIELVASEETGLPKPSMVTFDNAGRLWSATATAYPCDQDPEIWKRPGNDRIVIIDNPTAASPQTPRIFADGMVMPLSVLPSGKGVYAAQGPEILFLEDRDGDGRADSKKVLLHGYGVQDTHTLPHQLTRMPGGRIVYSQGVLNNGKVTDAAGRTVDFNKTVIATFRPDGTGHELIGTGLNNIWAWAVSREGKVFIHEANDFGYSVVPFEEDSTFPSFIQTKLHPATPMHPPTAEGLNLGGTGFSGLAICDDRSGSYPSPWHGLIYVSNPILGKIHGVSMQQGADGVFHFKKSGDLVSCADPMFRPVAITFGPDGCLYITDWYNRIISHNEVARDHPGRDKTRGRIWRVRHKSQPRRVIPDMTKVPAPELPARLGADSTWEVRAAWQEITTRGGTALAPSLAALMRDAKTADDTRIAALWTLEDMGYFDGPLWRELLASPNANVRREAVRSLTTLKVKSADAFALFQPLANEADWSVRYAMLRYFRRAGATPEQLAWLRRWSESPADKRQVNGWNGPYLALGGPYERAFQDFLFLLITDKTRSIASDPRWDQALTAGPAPTAEETAALKKRSAAIRALVSRDGPLDEARAIVQTTCLTCHRIGDKGVSLAPPLDGSASRDTQALIDSLLVPAAAIENVFRLYRVELNDGASVSGFRKNIDDKQITMMFMGGATQSIPLSSVKDAGYFPDQSVMPAFAAGLTDEQVADLVRYLKTVK